MRTSSLFLCSLCLACAPASDLEGTWRAHTVHDVVIEDTLTWWFTLQEGAGDGELGGDGTFQYTNKADASGADEGCAVDVFRSGGAWEFLFTFDQFEPLTLMCCVGCGFEGDQEELTCSPQGEEGEGVYGFQYEG